MRYKIVPLLSLAVLLPMLTHAAVVTREDVSRLEASAEAYGNQCIQLDQSLTPFGYGAMGAATDWKTVSLGAGITVKIPWSQSWYLIGKQIPWVDAEGGGWALGRYMRSVEGCGLNRQYRVWVTSDATQNSISKYFAPASDGPGNGVIIDQMVINGKKVALADVPGGVIDEQTIAVEITKNKVPYLVLISALDINTEMIRMAASIK